MPEVLIEELSNELKQTAKDFKDVLDRQADEIRKNGKASEKTKAKVLEFEEKMTAANSDIAAFDERVKQLEAKANRPGGNFGYQRPKSAGQQYIESDAFKNCQELSRGNNQPVEIKAISNDPLSAGDVTQEWQNPMIFADPERPTQVRDLVNRIPVSTDAVKVVRELLYSNNAAPQAGQLTAKAQSDITFQAETYPVETQAHWLPASRQILADAPMLRGFIDGRLLYGLDLLMDQQLLFGSGAGNNLRGIMVDPAVPDIGGSGGLTGDLLLDHVRKAITNCQTNEYYNVNGVVLNPQDWETIELAKGGDGHYLWVSVPNGGETRLWRVPVTITNAMTQGNFVLGDWSLGATLYDREQKSIRVSESHAELFIENAVAILAEERNAFAIELPNAFTKGQFAA